MPLTLLQIVNKAQGELGLPVATTVVGNTDPTTTQLFYLANRCIDEMRRDHRWTACQFEYNLVVQTPIITTGDLTEDSPIITNIPDTTGLEAVNWTVGANAVPQAARILSVDSSTQVTMTMEATETSTGVDVTFARDTYPIPSDFDFFNNQTMWDRTNRWQLIGPDSPQLNQFELSGVVATGPRRHFRQIGPHASVFRIWPAPVEIAQPLQLVFEYLSLNAVNVDGGGTEFAQYFENDEDTPLLDANAIIMGIKWMFWEIKGFNFVPMQNRWVDYLSKLAARDGAAPTLTLTRRPNPLLISSWNVPDGFWPGNS